MQFPKIELYKPTIARGRNHPINSDFESASALNFIPGTPIVLAGFGNGFQGKNEMVGLSTAAVRATLPV